MAEPSAVLDASALLALLAGEPGSDAVSDALPTSAISAVNLSEVIAKLADTGMPEAAARSAVESLGIAVWPFERQDAWTAGMLRPPTRRIGLSLGDRACLSLAIRLGVPAFTTDTAWKKLALPVAVRVVR